MVGNSENMIKGAIGETIVEEMFKELGFFVMRLGKEYTVNPINQLEDFVKICKGEFFLEKLDDKIKEVTHINVLPDFVVIHPGGKVLLLEVKFRWNGVLWNNDSLVFRTYPEAHMLIINLEVKDKVIDKKSEYLKELKNSRFHIWYKSDCTKENSMKEVRNLEVWLKDEFKLFNKPLIEKYQNLVKKWLGNLINKLSALYGNPPLPKLRKTLTSKPRLPPTNQKP